MNEVIPHENYKVSNKSEKLHKSLFITDLHSDTLLWSRNPEKRWKRGHVDLPRLREGGVNMQVFSAVTKSPRGLNFDSNSPDAPDDISLLIKAQLWPPRTWNSIFERAVYQAQRLHKLESNPSNNLLIVKNKTDMEHADKKILALLLTEGSHPLEGKIENINNLYGAGYRAMGLQHFFDNELGGSLHGKSQSGLTDFGREAVLEMERMNIMIDVAHSSINTVKDVLNTIDGPIFISHGGTISGCEKTFNRNLPDKILKEISKRGGILGIGYFDGAICDISPKGIAREIIHAISIMGENSIALGSDFDGTVTTTIDTSELSAITYQLLEQGLTEKQIRKVMGENARDFFLRNLPEI
jgi:microsomal dipeptidase-like Zn-dependent dipeptidase